LNLSPHDVQPIESLPHGKHQNKKLAEVLFKLKNKSSSSCLNTRQVKCKKVTKYQPIDGFISAAEMQAAYTAARNNRLPLKQNVTTEIQKQKSTITTTSLTAVKEATTKKRKPTTSQRIDNSTVKQQQVTSNQKQVRSLGKPLIDDRIPFPVVFNKKDPLGLNDHHEVRYLASKYGFFKPVAPSQQSQQPKRVALSFKEYRERKQSMCAYQLPQINRSLSQSTQPPRHLGVVITQQPPKHIGVTATQRPVKRSLYEANLMDILLPQKKRKLD